MSQLKSIRSAARAVIVCDGKLLVTKMRDKRGVFYILPGGGQLAGETLEEAVRRECMEEVGCRVVVDRLLYVREYIGKNHNFSRRHAGFHQLEHVFLCHVDDPSHACPGKEIDNHQVGVNWLALDNLENIRFYPEVIKQYLKPDCVDFPVLYLGDCN